MRSRLASKSCERLDGVRGLAAAGSFLTEIISGLALAVNTNTTGLFLLSKLAAASVFMLLKDELMEKRKKLPKAM